MATFPIRCFTCGKPINQLYKKYKERKDKGDSPYEILDDFGLNKMCCRRMFMSHATEKLEEYMLMYPTHDTKVVTVGVKTLSFKDRRAENKKIIEED